jgi:hypothetical protein
LRRAGLRRRITGQVALALAGGGEIGLEAAASSSMLAVALPAAELSKMLADLALKLGHAPLQRGEPCRVQSRPSSQLGKLAGRCVGEHRSDR